MHKTRVLPWSSEDLRTITETYRLNPRKPLHRHFQRLRELGNSLGGLRAASNFEIGQIALTDACHEIQTRLGFAAPVANGLQPVLTPEHCGADLRGQNDAASSQFGFPSIVEGEVVGILGLMIEAIEESLIFGPGQHHQFFARGVRMICSALMVSASPIGRCAPAADIDRQGRGCIVIEDHPVAANAEALAVAALKGCSCSSSDDIAVFCLLGRKFERNRLITRPTSPLLGFEGHPASTSRLGIYPAKRVAGSRMAVRETVIL